MSNIFQKLILKYERHQEEQGETTCFERQAL